MEEKIKENHKKLCITAQFLVRLPNQMPNLKLDKYIIESSVGRIESLK
jgi:hypothetical protein